MRKIKLTIPEPCHEDWNKMTPCDKGKFCASCQKAVIDFTNMSDRQIAEHFKKPQGSVCGRFMSDQLHRDIEMPRKRIPWIKYFFQFALPAFLISLKATAQKGKVVQKVDTVCTSTMLGGMVAIKPLPNKPVEKEISGTVQDTKGHPIVGATVMIKGSQEGTVTDPSGKFSIHAIEGQRLMVSSVGYESIEFIAAANNPVTLTVSEKLAGEIVVVGYAVRKPRPIPLIKRLMDTSASKFSVYPNPLKAGSNYSIDTKKLQAGDYVMNVIDNNGAIVQTSEVSIVSAKQVLSGNLPPVCEGNYFIRLTNKKTGVACSSKIVVQ
jgi:hypothetical protein